MSKYFIPLSLATVGLSAFLLLNREEVEETIIHNDTSRSIPIPTQVHEKMNDEEAFENAKESYFDLVHTGGQDIDWKAIIQNNFNDLIELRKEMKQNKAVFSYANGELAGEWFERGSTNQAGNVRVSDFDEVDENVYAISDGGILWKGDLVNSPWESLNDEFLLSPNVIESVRLPDGSLRIVSAVGHAIWYSDDEGETWTEATGFTGSTNGSGIDLIELNDNDSTLVYLYTQVFWNGSGQNKIAYSTDHGESFTFIQDLNSWNSGTASMSSPYNSSVAFIIDGSDDIYKFEGGTYTSVSLGNTFNGNATSQVETVMDGVDTVLYVLTNDENLYRSADAGATFTDMGPLATPAWEVGIGVSIDEPNTLFYGEVDTYRTTDAGANWNMISSWGDYYGDPSFYIHADIMDISTFKKTDGTEFTLICNHGGINISYDKCVTTPNAGMIDLNVGQLYDVATSPVNSSFIFGGTQDQGLQRTSFGSAPGTVTFEQVISGDYGAQQFSNNGNSFWTEYPFAQFSYYGNALSGGYDFWYDIDGDDMPNANWIVPTAAAPNTADDYILVGGGSATGGSGSFIIKLENISGSAQATNMPFDFKQESGTAIAALETTPFDYDKWYVATENGKFYHSEDAGINWTQTNNLNLPSNAWIWSNDIYSSRTNDSVVFVGGTNYGTSPVWYSTNGGEDFIATGDGIPGTMVHEMCMNDDESLLFAASDAGPYVYSVAQDEWFYLGGVDAPIQSYTSCEFISSEQIVRFASYGRGIWDFKMSDVTSVDEEVVNVHEKVYPNPSKDGRFTIETADYAQVKIFDMTGREVGQLALLPGANHLNLGYLGSGTYLMAGTDLYGRVIQQKIVID
ncbi:MAG: hypothetical protein ACI857_000733 [Arenicella sp.]|jgi:hypothetical protein